MSKELSVGDFVRFIFTSYRALIKSDYAQIYSVVDQRDDDLQLSLGGMYKIKEIQVNKWGVNMFRLLDSNKYEAWQPEGNIESIRDTTYCPFGVGQKLAFQPLSKEVDVDALVTWKNEYLSCNEFTLDRNLNGYYIYVKNRDGLIFDFPFLWFDFKPSLEK